MNRPPINLGLGLDLGKCPKCGHQTVKEVNEREVIGLTQCKTTGNKAVLSKRLNGVKCNYSNIKTMFVDSKGHRVA